jgi:hypothetical protein
MIRICLHLRPDPLTMTLMSDVTLCPMLKQREKEKRDDLVPNRHSSQL